MNDNVVCWITAEEAMALKDYLGRHSVSSTLDPIIYRLRQRLETVAPVVTPSVQRIPTAWRIP